jgi:hypothetical protein
MAAQRPPGFQRAGLPRQNPIMIGTLRETELHAALKRHYARPQDQLEVALAGYIADIVRADGEIIEIQTHNFSAIKRKLWQLVEQHRVRLVHPIATAKWITRVKADRKTVLGRRKSPRRGVWEDVFLELVSLPELMAHPNFTLEIVLIHEEEIRCLRTGRRRRRGSEWRVFNRRLLQVVDSVTFSTPADFRRFIPPDLATPFTSHELAVALQRPDYVAQKMTYCLRKMGTLSVVGKRGRAWLYAVEQLPRSPGNPGSVLPMNHPEVT